MPRAVLFCVLLLPTLPGDLTAHEKHRTTPERNVIMRFSDRERGEACVRMFAQAVSLPETKPSLRLRLSDEDPTDRISPEASSVCFISLHCLLKKVPETSVRNQKKSPSLTGVTRSHRVFLSGAVSSASHPK